MTDDPTQEIKDRISRRSLLKGTAGSIVAVSLAGCSGGGDGTTTTTSGGGDGGGGDTGGGGGGNTTTTSGGDKMMGGGKLKFAQAKSPIKFDPITLNDVPSGEVAGLIFDDLYNYDSGTKVVPKLAKKQPEVSKGGKRWVVPLKDGPKFHNGNPVTAADVKYSFEAPVELNTENAGELNMIDTVKTIDEKTVQFDLKYPFAPFKKNLVWSVVPKDLHKEQVSTKTVTTTPEEGTPTEKTVITKNKFKHNPVGSGPFKFDSWKEGSFVKLTRWDDYWDDPLPNLKEIEFTPVKEPTTRITTLKTGENHIIKTVPPKSWQTVKGMGNAGIQSKPGISYFYLAFNCKKGPTADPKVREAIDYSFSMDDAVSKFVEPSGLRQYSPLPQSVAKDWSMPLDKWKNIPHEKNVDKAKSMLDKNSNVPDDWNAKIIVPPDNKREQIGITVANGLKEAGYQAQVQRLDWGAFLKKYITGSPDDYNMFTLGWAGNPDPDAFMYFLFSQEQFGTTNGCFYKNDSVDQKIMDARQTTNRSKRQKWYQSAITTILQDRAHIPSYNLKNSFGVNNKVKDFKAHPVSQFRIVSDFNNTSIQ